MSSKEGMQEALATAKKPPKACAACHQRKVRCDFSSEGNSQSSCSNCRDAGVECKPHVRKRKHDRVDQNTSAIIQDEVGNSDTRVAEQTPPEATPDNAPGAATSITHEKDRVSEQISTLKKPKSKYKYTRIPSKRRKSRHDPRQVPIHECQPNREEQPSYLGRSDYVSAHVAIDEGDATQYQTLGSTTRAVQDLDKCILGNLTLVEPPQGMFRQTLVRNFMQRCRPWMPLLEEADLRELDLKNVNCLLTTCMLVAGSVVSTAPQAIEVAHRCYHRAKVLFYTGAEKNDIRVVMATILLQWLSPSGPEHVSIDSSSFWLKLSAGLAQQLGLHREPNSRMEDAALRRRIWWTLVSHDNQIAASHGRPRALNPEDTDVRPLRIEDFTEPDDDAHLFIHFVRITSILGELTELYRRGTLSEYKRMQIEDSLLRWVNEVPIPLTLHNPLMGEPYTYKAKALQLHLPYFASLIILFRQKNMDQAPPAASLLASSFISGIFEEFLTREDITSLAPTCIFYLMVAALVQLSSHRFNSLAVLEAIEIEIVKFSLTELQKRFPAAVGAERVINQVIRLSADKSKMLSEVDLVLPIEQHRFFLPFGSKLCRKWSSVFESSRNQGMPQQPITPLSLSVPQPREAYVNNIENEQRESTVDAAINSPWPVDNTQFASSFDTPIDLASFDMAGRWWWSDWISELEVPTLGG